jgi:hypothetical protein
VKKTLEPSPRDSILPLVPTLRVKEARPVVLPLRTRMPFKYGIATVTELPHVIVELVLEIDGRPARGWAADHLPPKWFTKNPETTVEHDTAELKDVVRSACGFAPTLPPAQSVFELWQSLHAAQQRWGAAKGYPALLWNFGVTFIERAMIDAFCRGTGRTFSAALRDDGLGLRLAELHPELAGHSIQEFIPREPLDSIRVRHTVGLSDPLTDADAADARLDDGLPESLEACIRDYGVALFKIKLAGDVTRDVERLRAVARVIGPEGQFTLDGNENYRDLASLRALWDAIRDEPWVGGLLFIEQPLHRDVALASDLRAWTDRPAVIIDESDDSPETFRRALDAGYAGTSYKSCKGVFKGIANACLARQRGRGVVISAEDLSTVGPVSLPQDLAVIASLGIEHAERNGHHYFRGLSAFPDDLQRRAAAAHPRLYTMRGPGLATLRIEEGRVDVTDVTRAAFGVGFDPDLSPFSTLFR